MAVRNNVRISPKNKVHHLNINRDQTLCGIHSIGSMETPSSLWNNCEDTADKVTCSSCKKVVRHCLTLHNKEKGV